MLVWINSDSNPWPAYKYKCLWRSKNYFVSARYNDVTTEVWKMKCVTRVSMFTASHHCINVLLSLNMRLNNPSRSDVRWCIPVIPQWVLLATKKFRRVVNSIGQCVFCVKTSNHCIKIQDFIYLQDNNTQYV